MTDQQAPTDKPRKKRGPPKKISPATPEQIKHIIENVNAKYDPSQPFYKQVVKNYSPENAKRRELFAIFLACGYSVLDAHSAAGYRPSKDHAYRLKNSPQIQSRIEFLRKKQNIPDVLAEALDVFIAEDRTQLAIDQQVYRLYTHLIKEALSAQDFTEARMALTALTTLVGTKRHGNEKPVKQAADGKRTRPKHRRSGGSPTPSSDPQPGGDRPGVEPADEAPVDPAQSAGGEVRQESVDDRARRAVEFLLEDPRDR